jgi:hypothetical protein
MTATTIPPDSPAPFSSVTAAKTTPAVNAAITAAKDLPDLVNRLQVVDPALASQLEGTALIASKTPLGTVIGLGVGWAVAHYGMACTAATVAAAGCWSQNTIDIVSGVGAVVGTAIAAYAMRLFTISPIAGLFSKAATPVEQVLLEKKVPGVLQPTPAPVAVVVPAAPLPPSVGVVP